jgi:hypothetical protein
VCTRKLSVCEERKEKKTKNVDSILLGSRERKKKFLINAERREWKPRRMMRRRRRTP